LILDLFEFSHFVEKIEQIDKVKLISGLEAVIDDKVDSA